MEPRYLLDTDTFIYIRREKPERVREKFRKLSAGEAAISVISFGELMYGVAKSVHKEAAKAQLQRIVEFVTLLELPEEAGAIYGTIRAELEAKGKMIGNNDLWIAAYAIAASLILVTNNEREFRRVSGLKIQNWAA